MQAAARVAETALVDIRNGDALIALTPAACLTEFGPPPMLPGNNGGRHAEVGAALVLGKPVYLVGQPENIFLRADGVSRVNSLADAVERAARDLRPGERQQGHSPAPPTTDLEGTS